MYLPVIYKNLIVLRLFKIVTLNFTMHIVKITSSLKIVSLKTRFFKTFNETTNYNFPL